MLSQNERDLAVSINPSIATVQDIQRRLEYLKYLETEKLPEAVNARLTVIHKTSKREQDTTTLQSKQLQDKLTRLREKFQREEETLLQQAQEIEDLAKLKGLQSKQQEEIVEQEAQHARDFLKDTAVMLETMLNNRSQQDAEAKQKQRDYVRKCSLEKMRRNVLEMAHYFSRLRSAAEREYDISGSELSENEFVIQYMAENMNLDRFNHS